jgi:hypothetical protein
VTTGHHHGWVVIRRLVFADWTDEDGVKLIGWWERHFELFDFMIVSWFADTRNKRRWLAKEMRIFRESGKGEERYVPVIPDR